MRFLISTLLVLLLLVVAAPTSAQSLPLTLLQPGSGAGFTLTGDRVEFSLAWSVLVFDEPPLSVDGLYDNSKLALGVSLPVLWATDRVGLQFTGILRAALGSLSGGAYLWSEAGERGLGGVYLRASLVRADF